MYKYNLKTDFSSNKTIKEKYENYSSFINEVFKKEYYPYQLNTWQDNIYYGIIDEDGDAIMPNSIYVKTLTMQALNNTTISNFDFVVDAFQELREYYSKFSINNKLAKNYNNIVNLNIKTGYIDFSKNFQETFAKQYKYFTESFIKDPDKIRSFDDFIAKFIEFVEMVSMTNIPVTQTGYILGRFGSVSNSGLCFSFEDNNVDHNDLKKKYNSYINDTNFDSLNNAANRFGFIIDKSAPWRMIADLNSPSMIDYMHQYGINNTNFYFKNRTIKLKYSDIDTLKKIIISFYNNFVNKNNIQNSVIAYKACNMHDYNFINVNSSRAKKSINLLQEKYDEYFFIRLYCFIKFREISLVLNQNEFDKIVKNAQKIFKFQSIIATMNYLDEFIRPTQTKKYQNLTSDEEIGKILSTLKQSEIRPTFKF